MFIEIFILSILFGTINYLLIHLIKGVTVGSVIYLTIGILLLGVVSNCENPTCDYFLDGVCVSVEKGINIDKEILSRSLAITERHVNSFYPGLELTTLAEEKSLRLHFVWDYEDTNLRGVYIDYNATSSVYKNGRNK